MTLQTALPISLTDVATEFGATVPFSLTGFYRVDGLDAADRAAGQVPSTVTTGSAASSSVVVYFGLDSIGSSWVGSVTDLSLAPVFTGTLSGSYSSSTELATDIETQWPGVSTTVFTGDDVPVPQGDALTFSTRGTGTFLSDGEWDIRDSSEILSNTVDYTSWDDLEGNWFLYDVPSGEDLPFGSTPTRIRLEIGDSIAVFATSSFLIIGGSYTLQLDTLELSEGTPSTDGALNLFSTLHNDMIAIDTMQTATVNPTVTFTSTLTSRQDLTTILEETAGGGITVTQINQNVPTSGDITLTDFLGATNGDT